MAYDFTTRYDRSHDGSAKWDAMYENRQVGADIVPLSVADMEFKTAPEITRAVIDFAENHAFGYQSPTEGYFEAVLGWQARRHNWEPERDWLCFSPGVIPALHAAITLFTEPGDSIIIQPPVYYPFMSAIELTGRTRVDNPLLLGTDGTYEMDFSDLEAKAADPANKLIILSSPHNPVGRVWTEEELSRLCEICVRNNVFICADEIHNDLIMPGQTHVTLAKCIPHGVERGYMVCTAPSKTFNLPGCHCSNIFIPGEEERAAYKAYLASMGRNSLNAFAYVVCEAAYRGGEAWLDELIEVIQGNWNFVAEHLAEVAPEIVVSPLEGTYLMWLDCRAWGLDKDALEELMISHDLFLDEGYLFGSEGEGFERINLACPRDVLEAMLVRFDAARDEALSRRNA